MTNQTNGAAILDAVRPFMPGGTNSSSYSVGANNPDGWEGIANGSQSLQAMIAPAVVVAGVVAAIAIPKIAAGHATTQQDMTKPAAGPAHLADATPPTAPPAQAPPSNGGTSTQ
jgi:hypothetical protein